LGTFLCEKGFTHKLLVLNSVRLAAAQAHRDVADLLDSGPRTGKSKGRS
jgi:hypothetical protein